MAGEVIVAETKRFTERFFDKGRSRISILFPEGDRLAGDVPFIGQESLRRDIRAAWSGGNRAFTLSGPCGVGKTAAVMSVVREFWPDIPLYVVASNEETEISDLLVSIRLPDGTRTRRGQYVAGPVLAAAFQGFLLCDEADKLSPRVYALFSSLLDGREALNVPLAGLPLKVWSGFRFAATLIDHGKIPEDLDSRMRPWLTMDYPSAEQLRRIAKAHQPAASPAILGALSDILADKRISVRAALTILKWAQGLAETSDPHGDPPDAKALVARAAAHVLGR